MADYSVKLDVFEGPMDLLLHLIKEEEINIYDISISRITTEYFKYMNMMEGLNLELAGEWILMAATLTNIKSRMLLPKQEADGEDGEIEDPREELIRRLLEYKKYKEAASEMREMEERQSKTFARDFISEWNTQDPDYLKEVPVTRLMELFHKILKKVDPEKLYEIKLEEVSVTEKMTSILEMLEEKPRHRFEDFFDDKSSRMELVGTLLAMLELMKQQLIRVFQEVEFGSIWVQTVEDETSELRDGELETISASITAVDYQPVSR